MRAGATLFRSHDGTVDVEALLEFARVHTDLPLGDEGVTRKDQYQNELLPTHRGMTKLDWSCRVWTDIRKMKFDEKGRLNGKRAARKRGKRVTIVVKPTKTNESGEESSGSLDLHLSDAEGVSGDSDGDARLKSNPFASLRAKRGKKVAGVRHTVKKGVVSKSEDYDEADMTDRERKLLARMRVAEEKLEEGKTRVQMAEDDALKADGKVDAMEQKLQGTDRQKLPTLVADRVLAYDSAERFRMTASGNFYLDMQIIAHLQTQAVDKKPHVVEGGKEETTQVPYSYQRPAQMLKLVSSVLNEDERAKKRDGRAHMRVNGAEWARAVLQKFWVKWDEDFPDVLQESRKKALIEAWHADWLSLRFWYYISPEQMLALLEDYQCRALAIGVTCTHEMVKKRYGELVLPAITGFSVGRPDWVNEVFLTGGVQLTASVLDRWYDQHNLDSCLPLSHPRNRTRLQSIEMDPNKASMLNAKNMPAPVPWEKRTVQLGFAPGAAEKAKGAYRRGRPGKESASVEVELDALIEGFTSEELRKLMQEHKESKESAAAGMKTPAGDGDRAV